jgi:hypothetical protein
MTREELEQFHDTVFEGEEGRLVVGVLAVTLRILIEEVHPRPRFPAPVGLVKEGDSDQNTGTSTLKESPVHEGVAGISSSPQGETAHKREL